MRKLILSLVFLSVVMSANAQFSYGGQFSINFSNEHTDYDSGATEDKEDAYLINLQPKFYWNLNDRTRVGFRVGFAYGHLTSGTVYFSDQDKPDSDTSTRALGWSGSPFFGYRLLDWKSVSVWAEANCFFGQCYNVKKNTSSNTAWNSQTEYGFQILPVVEIGLAEKLALQLHLGFISLGWYGTRSDYLNRVVTTSDWDLHKGGFSGIAQGLADYGISVVKTF